MIHAKPLQKKSDRLFINDLIDVFPKDAISKKADTLFKTKSSIDFTNNININNPADPLALQILPSHLELNNPTDFIIDPVGDNDAMKVPGLIHKYTNRVLLITTANCAIHCRYCFRRNFDYKNSVSKPKLLEDAMNYINNNQQINEVILSGGDPLTLNNKSLFRICDAILKVKHITTIRFHSRYPVVSLNRFDAEFLDYFKNYPLKKVFVSHINHPNELSSKTQHAFNQLLSSQFILLNQSVLLKNINDNADCLAKLSQQLFAQGVLPYYLHLLDKVKGASHFLTDEQTNAKIHQQLQASLPGYLVPKMVREIAGENSKVGYSKKCYSFD